MRGNTPCGGTVEPVAMTADSLLTFWDQDSTLRRHGRGQHRVHSPIIARHRDNHRPRLPRSVRPSLLRQIAVGTHVTAMLRPPGVPRSALSSAEIGSAGPARRQRYRFLW